MSAARILEETKAIISVDPDGRGERSCDGDFTCRDKYVSSFMRDMHVNLERS